MLHEKAEKFLQAFEIVLVTMGFVEAVTIFFIEISVYLILARLFDFIN